MIRYDKIRYKIYKEISWRNTLQVIIDHDCDHGDGDDDSVQHLDHNGLHDHHRYGDVSDL